MEHKVNRERGIFALNHSQHIMGDRLSKAYLIMYRYELHKLKVSLQHSVKITGYKCLQLVGVSFFFLVFF